jgi:hypothetical protein
MGNREEKQFPCHESFPLDQTFEIGRKVQVKWQIEYIKDTFVTL